MCEVELIEEAEADFAALDPGRVVRLKHKCVN
jgi:hypothetical protein